MIYISNKIFLLKLKIDNKIRKWFGKHSKLFSSKAILEKNFLEEKPFSFVQVGANDGVSFDFLYDFVIKRKSRGVVIEPIPDYFKELVSNYNYNSEIIKCNLAVHPTMQEINMYKIKAAATQKYPDWVRGIASLDPNHHLKTGIDSADISTEIVKASNFETILASIPWENFEIQYLQIDTEGFDFEVLKMVDLYKWKPLLVKFESVNLSAASKKGAVHLLKNFGYYIFDEAGDSIGVDLKKIKMY